MRCALLGSIINISLSQVRMSKGMRILEERVMVRVAAKGENTRRNPVEYSVLLNVIPYAAKQDCPKDFFLKKVHENIYRDLELGRIQHTTIYRYNGKWFLAENDALKEKELQEKR